jgi:ectoine hydroxylase-related dioxygenase (phytanoyl-CoA dioxygenase family)
MQAMAPDSTGNEISDFFFEHGYYHARGVFSHGEVGRLEEDFDRIVAQLRRTGGDINAKWKGAAIQEIGAADTEILHTHQVHSFSAEWARALFHPGFLAKAEAILGPDIVLHHTKLFQKPPEKGAPFPMHQDWQYFPTLKDTMIAGIVHVSEANDEMGCLRIVPGSHRIGRRERMMGQEDELEEEPYTLEKAIPVEAHAGDVVFFHYFTVHGSYPNRSTRTRKTVLVQMYAGDDLAEPGRHPDSRLVLRGFSSAMTRDHAGKL